jgi:hypothetical protein
MVNRESKSGLSFSTHDLPFTAYDSGPSPVDSFFSSHTLIFIDNLLQAGLLSPRLNSETLKSTIARLEKKPYQLG